MKSFPNRFLPTALLLVGLLVPCSADWTPQPLSNTNQDNDAIQFVFYVPDTSPGNLYPLVLHLHGNGGGPGELEKDSPILRTLSTPEWQSGRPCFIMGPACPQDDRQPFWVGIGWSGSYSIADVPITISMELVIDAIRDLGSQYPIDTNRIYVAGGSMGGFGTWDAVCRFPTMFAAANPLSGGGDPSRGALLSDMPIWAFHIATDPICSVEGTRSMIGSIEAAGGAPIYTEYTSGWHLWDQVWDPGNAEYWEPDLLPWLFEQSKDPSAATLRMDIEGLGTVGADPPGFVYAQGTSVTLYPDPGPGWVFDHWEGATQGNDNPLVVSIDASQEMVAVFTQLGPGKNIAFNAPISSLGEFGGYGPSLANDGDTTTAWVGTTGDQMPNWLEIAWPTDTVFDRVVVKGLNIVSWTLEYSTGGAYTELATGTGLPIDVTSGPITANRLRLTINSIVNDRPNVSEFSVYHLADVTRLGDGPLQNPVCPVSKSGTILTMDAGELVFQSHGEDILDVMIYSMRGELLAHPVHGARRVSWTPHLTTGRGHCLAHIRYRDRSEWVRVAVLVK